MSIHVALHHTTRYRYDRLVNLGPQVVRLRPAPHCRTPILAYSMTVEPAQHFINWQQDPFSNYLARLVFPERTEHFEITIDLVAEMSVYNPFDFFLEASAEQYPFSYDDALKTELAPYLVCDPPTSASPLFRTYLDGVDRTPAGTVNFLVALNQQLQRDIGYLVRMEPGVQTPEQTLELASGSCRDSAWLLVQLCRHLGIAARFVSGYLIQLTPDVKSLDGPSGTSVDFTDLHAWCEVYLPGAGWIGFDPTSGLLAGEGHIPLACTPQPTSAAPVEGLIDECEVSFEHEMTVTRVYESPRVTKPYTESQWDGVLALGTQVDGALAAGDVRLTQGGEPTFVSIDDRDGAEWNTDALGPTKRGYATELVQRLRAEYGDGGFLHFGQGKWYPGEQLPRWALSIFWRADGQPVWHDPSLFADEREPSAYTTDDAKRFIDALAARLNLTGEFIRPGYEDVWYYLWRERRLPVNVDPFDSRLDDELERARLRKVFEQQLDSVVGYVLPVKRTDDVDGRDRPGLDGPRWQTGPWFFRDERMYLVPGDSPMGYRLPLDSLPWASRADHPYLVERDPFAPRDALPDAAAIRARYAGPSDAPRYLSGVHREAAAQTVMQWRDDGTAGNGRPAARDPGRAPERFESAAWITRTALCVEVRNGILYLFMPPLAALEDYLDLLGAIELTAHALGVKLVLEGYPPPRDARLKLLQVTPDPGVIEVNIHPAGNFDELVDHTEFLYDAAWQSRLCSEKFMVDGRHVGTGGGNHFVLGGATPADSPFLRRPDLLASLIAYWHNHPSLSYLFSGLFIGPTSQAPRVDEARNDQLYELDIAFAEIQRNKLLFGQDMPPWLVDRVLRNLLIDVTGNTHRSEFCIDKLYSPDSSTGRLGLLELRAFEMPPHARMSIVQQLLLRAGRAFLGRAVHDAAHALGHRAARPLHAARVSSDGFRRRADRAARRRLCVRSGVVRAALRIPLPAVRPDRGERDAAVAARRAGAVARDGRGGRARRHGALRRFVGRTARGARDGAERQPARRDGQRPRAAAAADRHRRRIRRGRALQGVVAAVRAASDPRRARAAHVRHRRYVAAALARRLPLSRRASGRAQLRDVPGQCIRSREPPARALRRDGAHAGADGCRGCRAEPRIPVHARPAAAVTGR